MCLFYIQPHYFTKNLILASDQIKSLDHRIQKTIVLFTKIIAKHILFCQKNMINAMADTMFFKLKNSASGIAEFLECG
jgi:hypothetical protein